jgi:DNA-binding transcriptional LysR family regulator
MDLRRLQVFAKVYERRSFSRAAEEVLLSQPTVSGHIKSLEEEVGVPLFDRLGREIIPTRAAELLYAYATRILETVEEAGLALDAFLGRLRGGLVAGGSTIPAHYLLPGLVGRFRLLHPEVRVTVEVGDTREVARRTLAGELELGVVGAPPVDERLAVSPLTRDVVACAAWPEHRLAGRPTAPAELAREPLILREPGSGTRAFVERALRRAGVGPEDLTVAAQMGSTLAVIMGVRAQVGLGFVSRRALVDELAAGRLVELEIGGLELTRQFYLITRKGRTHSPAAQAFMALLLAEAGRDEEAA